MGLRFRRSVKILPGVRLNFSKSGVSTSVGVRGAHVTFGHGQVRETVGLPGTGISYTETHSTHDAAQQLQQQRTPDAMDVIARVIVYAAILLTAIVYLISKLA